MDKIIVKKFIIKNLKRIFFLLSVLIVVLLGALIGIVLVYQKGFPQIKDLEDIKPKVMTIIHDDQGKPVKEFAIEKRSIVRRQDIPDVLVNALIASEDNQFYSHWGINFKGTMRAIFGQIFNKNLGGGSSITQQLARDLFLTPERTWSRKLQEMLMAIQIEKRYSKDQILTFYCNKIFLGASVWGVEAGSRFYFGKSVNNINLAEAALIPTMMPAPNGKYNVFLQPENCLKKRNSILNRMLELKFITLPQYQEAINTPLPKKSYDISDEEIGDYFVEDTRKMVEAKYGDIRLYTGGLNVYTTLNVEMQKWAEKALKEGLRAFDKRRGWRGKLKNLILSADSTIDLETVELPSWKRLLLGKDEIVEGIALEVTAKEAIIKIGVHRGIMPAENAQWTRKELKRILQKGDVALFRIVGISSENTYPLTLSLEQDPVAQGAIMVVENKSGEIKAMVGGYSFSTNKWNNATQALRQTGSTIKPIIYTAAIENGYTAAHIIVDEYTTFDNEWTQEPYQPQNHTGDFYGPLTLRRGFEKSRNIISAKIVESVTPPVIVRYAKNFGITADLRPYMSIALGAFEVTLKEMTAAFTVFPNLGVRVNPYLIRKIVDQNNYIVEENYPEKKRVIEPETAYIMNYLMQGVVKHGTGYKARDLPAPIGGKTGTTDEYSDAWFIGFSPSLTVGVWIGHEKKERLGSEETGSRAASPIFVNFMEKYLAKYPEPQEYKRPSGVIMREIDKFTGKLAGKDCLYPFWEAFLKGTEPLEICTDDDHQRFHNYFKDEVDPENE
ncbi:MAG: PBP1A family penicillin-binding protein [Acidobacteria bacterium]|jgi:penicillin-binding protein 1A|nr:PBP1A family penicillin-binding protein [Acidobacteriota bacterium]